MSCFQVETIGDCLLVVSGLPVRNGNRHAAEIADMAFDILSLMTHFKIRHRPRMKLQLRVGLHSGKHVNNTRFVNYTRKKENYE